MKPVSMLVVFLALAPAAAEEPPSDPVAASLRLLYGQMKENLLESARKMPEAEYGFRLSPENRTFGENLAHVADANYNFCASALGRENPYPDVVQGTPGALEKQAAGKPQVLEALEASFAYCDEAFQQASDARLGEPVAFTSAVGRTHPPRALPLNLVIVHGGWMYGTVAMYLRAKGIVPPYTERIPELRARGEGAR